MVLHRSKNNKKEGEETNTCPICMDRKVNVFRALFSANQTHVLINFVIVACQNGEGYAIIYSEKRKLPYMPQGHTPNPLQKANTRT